MLKTKSPISDLNPFWTLSDWGGLRPPGPPRFSNPSLLLTAHPGRGLACWLKDHCGSQKVSITPQKWIYTVTDYDVNTADIRSFCFQVRDWKKVLHNCDEQHIQWWWPQYGSQDFFMRAQLNLDYKCVNNLIQFTLFRLLLQIRHWF